MRRSVVRERFAPCRHRHGLRIDRQRIRSRRHIAVVRILGLYLHAQGPRIGNAGRCGAPGFAAIRAIADGRAGTAVGFDCRTLQSLPIVGLARIIRRNLEVASLVDDQLAFGDRDIIVGYRRVTLLDRDLLRGLVELRNIGSDRSLALRTVVAIDNVNLSVDAITGKQSLDGVFIVVRVRHGLGLTIIGMARAIDLNRQRHRIVNSDDIFRRIRINRDALVRAVAVHARVGICRVERRSFARRQRFTDGLFTFLIICNLHIRTLEVMMNCVVCKVQIKV